MADANATRALLKVRWRHTDKYVGTAQQFIACGLVQPDQFPGQPGRGKVRATYFVSDGQPVLHGGAGFEQTYTVQRVSSTRFSVSVSVSDQECRRREAVPADYRGQLPLELPETPAFEAPAAPTWAPLGFQFRRKREHDYVFEATAEHLLQSDLVERQALPGSDGQRAKSVRFQSLQFGWGAVAQRTANTFFVVLSPPREIRNADYRVSDHGSTVYHYGTKQQLRERGLGVGMGFPGEPGSHSKKVKAHEPDTGNEICIELMGPFDWFGNVPRFRLSVDRTEAEQEALKKAKREADTEKARLERLKSMPATPDKFRDEVAQTFWTLANITKAQMQSNDGYRFTSEVVDEFIEASSRAYWVLKHGATAGSSPQRQFHEVVCANAKADEPLQAFLAGLRPDSAH